MESGQSFGLPWERYLFKMATLIIDLVPSSDQAKLIDLIYKADATCSDHTDPRPEELAVGQDNLEDSPVVRLTHQWREALALPPTSRYTCQEDNLVILSRAFAVNQQQIESIQLCLVRTNELVNREKSRMPATLLQTPLLIHYQRIQARYSTYLSILKIAQTKYTSRLNR